MADRTPQRADETDPTTDPKTDPTTVPKTDQDVLEAGAGERTRRLLVEAATLGFAYDGVHTASLLEITRRAGQRNRGAVHYHFGSRTGMLVAVLERHVDLIADRQRELLTRAQEQPDDDLVSAVEALTLPAVELAAMGPQQRAYLSILAQLVDDADEQMDPAVVAVLHRTGGYEAFALAEERMPPMAAEVRAERLALVAAFTLRTVADRGRAAERADGRAQLPDGPFAANLVAMVVGMLGAPAPTA